MYKMCKTAIFWKPTSEHKGRLQEDGEKADLWEQDTALAEPGAQMQTWMTLPCWFFLLKQDKNISLILSWSFGWIKTKISLSHKDVMNYSPRG